jgi:hypothetical protein
MDCLRKTENILHTNNTPSRTDYYRVPQNTSPERNDYPSTLRPRAIPGPWRPIGLSDVKGPTLSRHSAHRWPQSEGRALLCFWYSFLLETERTRVPSVTRRER